LIGDPIEVCCKVNNIETFALLDTGSQVSSISEAYFQKHFAGETLHDVSELLKVETVSGDVLPYQGYVECSISIPVTDSDFFTETVPVLVVPNTTYNSSIPLLVGNNILCKLVDFAVVPTLPALKIVIQTLRLRARHLSKSDGIYGNVFATDDISVPPFSGKISQGSVAITIPICQ